MNRIHLLPENVANQIAAGEVVERPASVVKELVENSLDSGARKIHVEILAAGRGLIRVVDDGSGMSRDDALLCFERHATSKITAAQDLTRIQTLGFRGEAVPSIASISRFTLTTRERNDGDSVAPGTQIVIHGGRILEVREDGAADGTTIEVRGLFYNVPARRKFLRSDETERAHVQHWLSTIALAHPEVAFSLVMEERVVWKLPALPPADSTEARLRCLRERLRLLMGEGLTVLPVERSGELGPVRQPTRDVGESPEISQPAAVRLWGWIGAPGVSRATREDQHLFVNRRPIENRGLNAALVEGYHNVLMKGRYPLGCLFLELDPSEVDVNIHPAKREVKFHRERAVRQFVAESVREALKSWHAPVAAPSPEAIALPGLPFPQRPPAPATPAESAAPKPSHPESSPQKEFPMAAPDPIPVADPGTVTELEKPAAAGGPSVTPATAAPTQVTPGEDRQPLLAIPLRVVGVVGRLYVVLESERGLVLLDQHAAHERVLYEQMLRRNEQAAAPSQRLLLPETIELSPKDAEFLRENLPVLTRLGVGLSEFGERTFLLDSLPPFVRVASPRRFALELVDELRAAGSGVNVWRLGEAMVAKTVCRHAVKANDFLGGPEIEALIADLRRCDMPYTCPHGRPTLIELGYRELEKKFGRIQG